MPAKTFKTTAEKSGIAPVSVVVKRIETTMQAPEKEKKPRKKVELSPEDAQKRREILCERLKKARAVKAERQAQKKIDN